MSRSVWLILCMGGVTAVLVSVAMVFSLSQFQETSVVEWVKLAEMIQNRFQFEHVSVRVSLRSSPSILNIAYLTRANSHFDLSQQNDEMDRVARFACENYKGRDLVMIEQAKITRSEVHGSGCFQQTYVAHFGLANPRYRMEIPTPFGAPPPDPAQR